MLISRILVTACMLTLAAVVSACGGTGSPAEQGLARATTDPSAAAPATRAVPTPATSVCAVTQQDLTTAMNDLQVRGFSAWETSWATGNVDADASMTKNPARVEEAMNDVASLMRILASSSGATARNVIADLSDSGQSFADLVSGDGTASDEAVIVHTLSRAIAATVRTCGPSPVTRYAPAQEAALDKMSGLRVSDTSSLQALGAALSAKLS